MFLSSAKQQSSSDLKPLKLHAHASGPNPYKIAIVLEALHVPYEVKMWEFGDGPNSVKGPEFLKINENGRVPAVEDPNTGVVSWESGAIINYLLRVYDKQNALGPKGESEQDKVDFDKWNFFLLTSLGPMMGQTNWYRHYNEQKNDDALERYVAQSYRTFDVFEGQLKRTNGDSVLPGGFSAADANFYPWVNQYEFAGLSLDKYPLIQKWYQKVGEMEAVKKGYERMESAAK